MVPKLGDFGLVRMGTPGTGHTSSKNLTQNAIGTTVYMAHEAFLGDVSVKLDTFSFGVVLLELLTGLKPFDEDREEPHILCLVEEKVDTEGEDLDIECVKSLLDPLGSPWDSWVGLELFRVSKLATEQKKKNRPTVVQILPLLEKLQKPNTS
jgi:interleukin-1 receptor-associated kinase 4